MKNFANSRVGAVVIGASAIVVLGGTGAYAATQITSGDIKDQTIQARDIHSSGVGNSELKDNSASMSKLGTGVQNKLNQIGQKADQSALQKEAQDRQSADQGLQGQVNDTTKNVEAGADYNHVWKGDNGQNLNTIVESCPNGQVALGGGYSTWGGTDTNKGGTPYDMGGDNKNIQVTVSAPYSEDTYDPNKNDGNIRPTEWVIKGYNNGSTDQIVRDWVVCAKTN